jgi:hypothetical protein
MHWNSSRNYTYPFIDVPYSRQKNCGHNCLLAKKYTLKRCEICSNLLRVIVRVGDLILVTSSAKATWR